MEMREEKKRFDCLQAKIVRTWAVLITALFVVTLSSCTCNLVRQSKEAGFVPLFNGKDLTGWTGNIKGHVVEDGKIVALGRGGNLYTIQEYSDFVLRFEFKLTPGANNGLGIRSPMKGVPAYAGIELQILDDTAEKWKDLKPYQFHGSVYGVVPAKKGHLRPVGEWNYEEITAKGRQIIVKLNGATILNVDLDKIDVENTPDGHDHPGLKRDKGHIAIIGHGDQLEFRNIRIKEL